MPDAERDRNLETLQFISQQAAAHGLHFQLGLWMHGYEWANSPHANYTIEGLTAENHAAYCRDALTALLRACPAIAGVTFRVHGESGVTEGSYDFWKTVFDGAVRCGRKVEIDMHAKGIDQRMIDVGLATGLPVTVSPKFVAEHMGMPYHQAAIREQEMPHGERTGLMALSTGTRSFTRYSFADLLREDRRYSVLHRVWPGTQRLLIWGDPVTASAYARAFEICGSSGAEIMEPLSFKGRRGSGKPGGRCGYADASLNPRWDWQKYLRTYNVWGAALYDPDTRLPSQGIEKALESASRILPIVTTAHAPSAANNTYWPEMYTAQPMVDPAHNNPYTDTPSPKTFGNASPFDPQLFSGVNEFAADLLEQRRRSESIRRSRWRSGCRIWRATQHRNSQEPGRRRPWRRGAWRSMWEFRRRWGVSSRRDSAPACSIAIHERTGDRTALEEALKMYRSARDIWAKMAESARSVYVADVTVGELAWLRGHWTDRLPAIDADIANMAKRLDAARAADPGGRACKGGHRRGAGSSRAWQLSLAATRPSRTCATKSRSTSNSRRHRRGSARLWYRHFNQAERWQTMEMLPLPDSDRFRASIDASFTQSPYPVQYYFEVRLSPEKVWLYPGFDASRANQPYYLVRPL